VVYRFLSIHMSQDLCAHMLLLSAFAISSEARSAMRDTSTPAIRTKTIHPTTYPRTSAVVAPVPSVSPNTRFLTPWTSSGPNELANSQRLECGVNRFSFSAICPQEHEKNKRDGGKPSKLTASEQPEATRQPNEACRREKKRNCHDASYREDRQRSAAVPPP